MTPLWPTRSMTRATLRSLDCFLGRREPFERPARNPPIAPAPWTFHVPSVSSATLPSPRSVESTLRVVAQISNMRAERFLTAHSTFNTSSGLSSSSNHFVPTALFATKKTGVLRQSHHIRRSVMLGSMIPWFCYDDI